MTSSNYPYGMGRKLVVKGSVDSGFQEPIDPITPHEVPMDMNTHFSPIGRKGEIAQSPLASPVIERRQNMFQDQQLQQQLATLKQRQELQHQLLLQQFQAQQQQLAQEHEKELHDHISVNMQIAFIQKQKEFLDQSRKLEEQHRLKKEMLEKEKLEQIKNKNKSEESAVASSAVKQKLQEFVLTKRQRETTHRNSPPHYRHWGDQSSPPQAGLSPPYSHMLGKYEDDFPLRKTASEPNLKVRSALKQKLENQRRFNHSPILGRKGKMCSAFVKRKTPLSIDCSSNSDSAPNSPPSGPHSSLANGSVSSLHSKEESSCYPPYMSIYPGSAFHNNTDLYPSPSMPNISLGKPPSSSSTNGTSGIAEADLRAMEAARGASIPMMHGSMPFYPTLPVMESEYNHHASPAYISAQMKAMEEAQTKGKYPMTSHPYTTIPGVGTPGSAASEAHQASIHRHKKLGRTHSAPLPLGHPYLQQQHNLLLQQAPQPPPQQPTPSEIAFRDKKSVKQQIRHAVLQKVGSKSHMENVDEETEAKLAQELKETREQTSHHMIPIAKDEKMYDVEKRQRPAELETFPSHIRHRHKGPSHHRPLARTQSSPLVTFNMTSQQPETRYTFTTAIAYDNIMQKHECTCGNNDNHPEHSGRLQSIWTRLQETSLIARCERLKCRRASITELQSCHTEAHTLLYGTNSLSRVRLDQNLFENSRFCLLPCGGVGVDSDTVWNEYHTYIAARTAAGSVAELALRVGSGELKNGFALVRPPGHHAEAQQAMGFCYFNNVAIAAKQAKEKLKLDRILIVDWDVHHGNSTQQMFYSDPSVLYISIHRHDNGNFFPGTGSTEECGADEGLGFNVNIAFGGSLDPPMRDAEFLAAFRTVVMPIAKDYRPQLVLVSSGFDAAKGHPAPLGGYEVSAECFGHMTRELMSLADGKIVLALEGGYELTAICDATEMCVKALLGEELPPVLEEELNRPPCQPAIQTLDETIKTQVKHWRCVERFQATIQLSLIDAQKREIEEENTVSALASLSMVNAKRSNSTDQESEPMEEES